MDTKPNKALSSSKKLKSSGHTNAEIDYYHMWGAHNAHLDTYATAQRSWNTK